MTSRALALYCPGLVMLTTSLCPPCARASIVYRDIPDISLQPPPPPRPPYGTLTPRLDLDGDGVDDFGFRFDWTPYGHRLNVTSLSSLPGVVWREDLVTYGPDRIDAGFIIQPTLDQPGLGFRDWKSGGDLYNDYEGNHEGWWEAAPPTWGSGSRRRGALATDGSR